MILSNIVRKENNHLWREFIWFLIGCNFLIHYNKSVFFSQNKIFLRCRFNTLRDKQYKERKNRHFLRFLFHFFQIHFWSIIQVKLRGRVNNKLNFGNFNSEAQPPQATQSLGAGVEGLVLRASVLRVWRVVVRPDSGTCVCWGRWQPGAWVRRRPRRLRCFHPAVLHLLTVRLGVGCRSLLSAVKRNVSCQPQKRGR